MQTTWADISPLDADTEKMLNSFLADPSVNKHNSADEVAMNANAFNASGWPGSVHRSLSDNAPIFGLSPSVPMGVSPGLAGFYQDQSDPTKLSDPWSLPSDFTSVPSSASNLSNMYRTLSDAMPPSLSNDSAYTTSDAQSSHGDMLQPLATIPA